ncbi:MAG: RusA family crossover junction endodeoxyribonuclease [Meiothermus silvanus]|nr:RusA family crossover junction endodeoxyribonuclease [Allomeiothermus silvanus]
MMRRRPACLCLPWPPASGNHQYGRRTRGVYLRREVTAWRDEVAWLARGWRAEPPVELRIRLFPPDRRRRDADNVLKLLLDALVQGGVLSDDSNRVVRAYRLEWGQPRPGGAIEVEWVRASWSDR